MRVTVGTMAAALALAGCAGDRGTMGAPVAGAVSAVADVRNAAGVSLGRAMATEVRGGLRVSFDVHGLTPGLHGAQLNATGRCDPPDFATAGARDGTLPNLIADRDGRATLAATIPGMTLAGLVDADGAAVVIDAAPDDSIADPAGNHNARIACGVFAPV